MKISKIIDVLGAKLVIGADQLNHEVVFGFASDLMSDVLTLETDGLLLITGLANLQCIRTAEMSDINVILLVRNKKATSEMLELAKENNIAIIETKTSMFRAITALANIGLEPVY